MLADTLYILGYRPEDDSWDTEGRRTYIHDDDASRAWLIALARVLGRQGWERHKTDLRAFAHANGELIELEIGGADTNGHYLHHLSTTFQPVQGIRVRGTVCAIMWPGCKGPDQVPIGAVERCP